MVITISCNQWEKNKWDLVTLYDFYKVINLINYVAGKRKPFFIPVGSCSCHYTSFPEPFYHPIFFFYFILLVLCLKKSFSTRRNSLQLVASVALLSCLWELCWWNSLFKLRGLGASTSCERGMSPLCPGKTTLWKDPRKSFIDQHHWDNLPSVSHET